MRREPVTSTSRQSTRSGDPAVIYTRVSSKEQAREGFSIPAQQKLLRQYAREHDVTIVQEFVDIETAKSTGRRGFGRMVAFLKDDPSCKVVLVEKTDRLCRNLRDWVTLEDLGLEVHLVKEGTVLSPDSGSSEKFMSGIRLLMAKQYVDNLSEEVKKGLLEKAEQGHWPSVAHVGYANNLATHRIEVDPVRGPQITALFDLYATGEYSLKALVTKAHAIGLTHPRSGRRMMKGEIHRILKNVIYAGDFRWKGRLYKGLHERLVTRERFAEVQAVLTRKPRARYPKQKHAFMGLLTCARCDCAVTRLIQTARRTLAARPSAPRPCRAWCLWLDTLRPIVVPHGKLCNKKMGGTRTVSATNQPRRPLQRLGMDVRAETARGGPTSHTQMSSECDPLRTLL